MLNKTTGFRGINGKPLAGKLVKNSITASWPEGRGGNLAGCRAVLRGHSIGQFLGEYRFGEWNFIRSIKKLNFDPKLFLGESSDAR